MFCLRKIPKSKWSGENVFDMKYKSKTLLYCFKNMNVSSKKKIYCGTDCMVSFCEMKLFSELSKCMELQSRI